MESVLACVIHEAENLSEISATIEDKELIAARLDALVSEAAKSRVAFIRRQLHGDAAEDLFQQWREQWGIPVFRENLVSISDFENGFMWRFRDHTTSWSDNQVAQEWFLTSLEAQTITQYEFWSCDNGPEECIDKVTGTYKQILEKLLAEGVYEVLISPVFTDEELKDYIEQYDEDEQDFSIEEVIEDYISQNPNFVT
ncbi:hypothetical protein FY528_16410 [Hymenobacter lutimineralis]|uniref:Uncharacterized protein n=1 Tax=Hymenobacter lutimineralis TaxID=2606448 RepID=A0A5D6UW20_9BACT|nr:hypothetical protein [Hymenobacter lutimineralis]TYZ07088.1 hypothetical protein FY528_16410 [Hymenobacter lutimineralis]